MNRDFARAIKNQITGQNIYTTFQVDGQRLVVHAPGGLSDLQRQLIRENKEELIELFTTPPGAGICTGGHQARWHLTKYGDWLCICASRHRNNIVSVDDASQAS